MPGPPRRAARRAAAPALALALTLPVGGVTPAVAAPVEPLGITGAPVAVVDLGVAEIADLLASGATTSVELSRQYLRRIAAYEEAYAGQPGVNAVITMSPYVLADAARLDAERAAGQVRGPLHGVPLVLKDNYDTSDLPTSNASLALAGMRPPVDATQVERLREAGAVVVAKVNLHEFARGITTVSSLGGQTRNPYDQTRNPGGSSGGTAAAVAASFAAVGMGSDTCGSIRYPAAHTALVGLRPTQGLFTAAGVIPLSTTQDVAGPLGQSVEDVAIVLDATKGADPRDPATSVAVDTTPASFRAGLTDTALRGARIGVLTDYLGGQGAEQQEVTALIRAAAADMTGQGATVVDVGPQPALLAAVGAASVIGDEFERDLDAYLATPGLALPAGLAGRAAPADRATLADVVAHGGVTPTVLDDLRRSVFNPPLPNASYRAKLANREQARRLLTELLGTLDLDALAYPTLRQPAAPIGQAQPGGNCSLAANTGFPALTVPAGRTARGLPVGVELLGAPFSDPRLLALGHDYERATGHRVPPPTTPELPAARCDPAAESAFVDTAPPHGTAVACLAGLGVVRGVSADRFAPTRPVTRGQFASMLSRALDEVGVPAPAPRPDAFGDDDGTAHEPALNALAALGVLRGVPGGGSGQGLTITRGQAASLANRALGEVLYVVPAARLDAFPDDSGSVHEPAINALASFGALTGVAPDDGDHDGTLSRGQAASLLARLLF